MDADVGVGRDDGKLVVKLLFRVVIGAMPMDVGVWGSLTFCEFGFPFDAEKTNKKKRNFRIFDFSEKDRSLERLVTHSCFAFSVAVPFPAELA